MKKQLIKKIDNYINFIQKQVKYGISDINLNNLFIVLNEN